MKGGGIMGGPGGKGAGAAGGRGPESGTDTVCLKAEPGLGPRGLCSSVSWTTPVLRWKPGASLSSEVPPNLGRQVLRTDG